MDFAIELNNLGIAFLDCSKPNDALSFFRDAVRIIHHIRSHQAPVASEASSRFPADDNVEVNTTNILPHQLMISKREKIQAGMTFLLEQNQEIYDKYFGTSNNLTADTTTHAPSSYDSHATEFDSNVKLVKILSDQEFTYQINNNNNPSTCDCSVSQSDANVHLSYMYRKVVPIPASAKSSWSVRKTSGIVLYNTAVAFHLKPFLGGASPEASPSGDISAKALRLYEMSYNLLRDEHEEETQRRQQLTDSNNPDESREQQQQDSLRIRLMMSIFNNCGLVHYDQCEYDAARQFFDGMVQFIQIVASSAITTRNTATSFARSELEFFLYNSLVLIEPPCAVAA